MGLVVVSKVVVEGGWVLDKRRPMFGQLLLKLEFTTKLTLATILAHLNEKKIAIWEEPFIPSC